MTCIAIACTVTRVFSKRYKRIPTRLFSTIPDKFWLYYRKACKFTEHAYKTDRYFNWYKSLNRINYKHYLTKQNYLEQNPKLRKNWSRLLFELKHICSFIFFSLRIFQVTTIFHHQRNLNLNSRLPKNNKNRHFLKKLIPNINGLVLDNVKYDKGALMSTPPPTKLTLNRGSVCSNIHAAMACPAS